MGPKEKGCIFCNRIKQRSDRLNLILHRGKKCFVIMNKYPYNSGHLMVVPKIHKGEIESLSSSEWSEMNIMARNCVSIIKKAMPADGFNIGMNLGAIAGAGIKDHLHIHVVPRFLGDNNFMPVAGNARVQSFSLDEIYLLFKPGFDSLRGKS